MNAKRITALVLAGLMLVGTMGYIFSMIASAATVGGGIGRNITLTGYRVLGTSGTANVLKEIKKDTSFNLELTLKGSSTDGQKLLDDLVASSANSSKKAAEVSQTTYFQAENGSAAEMKVSTSSSDTYILTITQLKYHNDSGKTVELTLNTNPTVDFDFDISECTKDSSGGSSSSTPDDPDDPTPTPTPSGDLELTCFVERVTNSTGKSVYFDIEKGINKDSSIRTGYKATLRVRVKDPGGTVEDIKGAAAELDLSSFTNGTIAIDGIEAIKEGGVRYYINFTDVSYSGSGNTLSAVVKNDTTGYYAEIVSSVAECIPYKPKDDNDDDDDDDYSDLAVATPYVIINSYGYGGREITAGETFTLSLTLYNTSANVDVQNMMVTVSMPDDLMLTSSSNTFYIANLATEESVTKSIQVTAKPAAKAQSHNIGVSMKYQYIDHHTNARRDNTTEETIAIPVVQVDRFQVTGIDAQAEINVGEEGLITVNFVNKGRSDVYNISAEISGNIQNPGQQQNLGNLTSGTTGTVDFYPIPLESGPVNGQVTITYEDTNMVEKTVTIDYSCTAISYEDMMGGGGMFDPGMDVIDPGMMGEGEGDGTEKSPAPWVIGGVAVAAVAAFIIKKKIDKKRSEAADADL